jgi:hypothetical protein
MSIRSFSNSSIKTGEKRSKFWDQNTVILNPGFESIASATGTGANTYTFSSIPQTFTSLQIRCLAFRNNVTPSFYIRFYFNGDTSSIYGQHLIMGDGTSVIVGGQQTISFMSAMTGDVGLTLDYGSAAIVDIHDYTSTSRNKTIRSFSGTDRNGTGGVQLLSGLSQSTSAVTSITLSVPGALSTSTFALYGIKGAA